jgi:hypothetical protein
MAASRQRHSNGEDQTNSCLERDFRLGGEGPQRQSGETVPESEDHIDRTSSDLGLAQAYSLSIVSRRLEEVHAAIATHASELLLQAALAYCPNEPEAYGESRRN